jgi:hypothetical protein
MLDLRRLRFIFPATQGGPQIQTQRVGFSSPVRLADAVINGFDIGYVDSDHHLLRTQIDVNAIIVINTGVNVTVNFSLRDASGNFDDRYSGFVDVLVIADLT